MHDTIADRIKKLRERLHYSQEAFGAPASLQFHQISKYERGEVVPTTDALNRLSEAYHVNLHWLITGDGGMFVARNADKSRAASEITSAEELNSIASKLQDAYQKFLVFKLTATAPWVLNLVKSLRILLEIREKVQRKRKLWRGTDVDDNVMHDLDSYFPGEKAINIMERIEKAVEKLDAVERVDADYAWHIATCFKTVVNEFAFLEYAGKYKLPDPILKEITALLVPWCDWVGRAANSKCLPLEVHPSLLTVDRGNNLENMQEIWIEKNAGLVSMDAYTKEQRSVFRCRFRFMQEKLTVSCGAVDIYVLIKALDKLAEDPEKGYVEIGVWTLHKDYKVYTITKNDTRLGLDRDDFDQFVNLVNVLWERPDIKAAVVRNVLSECGAL
jgi:transcriptional regulator with XRE-family HTH domain